MDLRVKKGDAITAEAWNALVASATEPLDFNALDFARLGIKVATRAPNKDWLFRDGEWETEAIIDGKRVVVFSPTATRKPSLETFHAFRRVGRWESLENVPVDPLYRAGDGVAIDEENGVISNLGFRGFWCDGVLLSGDIHFGSSYFDISDNGVISVKRRASRVLTGLSISGFTESEKWVNYFPNNTNQSCSNCGAKNSFHWTQIVKTPNINATYEYLS